MSKSGPVRRQNRTKSTRSGIAPVPWSVVWMKPYAPAIEDADGNDVLIGTGIVDATAADDYAILTRIADAMNAHEGAQAEAT